MNKYILQKYFEQYQTQFYEKYFVGHETEWHVNIKF